jgi:hypothetical protein
MNSFLASLTAAAQTVIPLIPVATGAATTVKQLFDLGSQVIAAGTEPTNEQWLKLVDIQNQVLADIRQATT